MAENVQQSIEVPVGLSVFGSLITEMSPSDLPEGVSPDNQDVVFLPGSVASRPGLHKLYPQLGNNVTVTSHKTFVAPDGNIYNLVLDSLGRLWRESVFSAPGILSQIATVAPGSYFTSVTAFGREYMAFNDGQNPTDVPRQYDGLNFDRVSQDGPAEPPQVAEENLSFGITSITQGPALTITAAPNGLVQVGNLVTITISTSTVGLQVGDTVVVAGATNAGYNGTFAIVGLTNTTIQVINATSGLAASGAGTVSDGLSAIVIVTPAWGFTGVNQASYVTIAGASIAGYNGTWPIRLITLGGSNTITVQTNITGLTPAGTAGTVAAAGNIPAGVHGCVVMFLTRNGYVTTPSPPVTWTASGGKRVTLNNLPIGPVNVIARILAFTGAGGSRFFYLLDSVTVPVAIGATSVRDNTSTSATIDFSDTALFGGIAIDISGNDLFAQTILGPSVGVFNYASRMIWWGQRNKINNFLNMSFDGGSPSLGVLGRPLGWTVDPVFGAGGVLNAISAELGLAWETIGDGTNNPRGMLTQSAWRDLFGVPILQTSTLYSFNFWLGQNPGAGNIIAEFYSPGQGSLAVASFNLVGKAIGKFYNVVFNNNTPISIPADALLRIYTTGTPNTFFTVFDEISICYTQQPFSGRFSISYVDNPEAFDGVTGLLGSTEDPTPLRACFTYKDILHFLTARGLHSTRDLPSSEPALWSVEEISNRCGACSPRAVDMGENFAVWVTAPTTEPPTGNGLYLFTGGAVYKVSQEIQPNFDAINAAARKTVWVKNDPVNRRIYCGVPIAGATAPNQILVMDYREMDTASDIASRPPIHISFTGRMICSDLSRKWTKWNVSANCGELLTLPNGLVTFCVGAGNGVTPGQQNGFGNVYYFDVNKLTDDDYGTIVPYYITYFFINHEAEQALQVGLHRKLYKRYNAYMTGVGQLQITAYADTLSNPTPSPVNLSLNSQQFFDLGDGLNVSAERVAFKIASIPNIGQTDNKFDIGKFIVTMMQEPMSPLRFGAI